MLFQWGIGDAPCQQCMNGEVTSRLDHSRLDFLHHTCLRVLPTSNKKIRNSSQRPFLCFRIAFLWIILNSAFGPITGFRAILVSLSCVCAVFRKIDVVYSGWEGYLWLETLCSLKWGKQVRAIFRGRHVPGNLPGNTASSESTEKKHHEADHSPRLSFFFVKLGNHTRPFHMFFLFAQVFSYIIF